MEVLEGKRHFVGLGPDACRECLAEQLDITDAFFLRTGNSVSQVSEISDNPFAAASLEAARNCAFPWGISIDRQTLMTRNARSTCRHQDNSAASAVRSTNYRARSLGEFFRTVAEEDFVSPVHATIGFDISHDLSGLVTAKSSGFLIRYHGDASFTKPWGGHRDNFMDAARLGILEGIERICGESPRDGQVVEDPPATLRQIELESFGLPDMRWNIAHPDVGAWVQGTTLHPTGDLFGEAVLVPERLAYYSPTVDTVPWVQESSNGCAIGGKDTEALLFGLLEVLERDAFLIAWYGQLQLVPIDPATVRHPISRSYLERLELCGVRVTLLNATVGIGIPTVIAVCEEPGGSTCVGAGSHPDPERALNSALIEVASDFQVVAHQRISRTSELEAMVHDTTRVRVMEDHANMFAHPDARPFIDHWTNPVKQMIDLESLQDPGHVAGETVEADLAYCLEQCADAGFEVVAIDQTHGLAASIGAAAWKVLVPGLIPIDFGLHQRVVHMPRLEERVRCYGDLETTQNFRPSPIPHPFP